MRFFTPGWHQNLSEVSDPVAVAYANYVREFWPLLPDAARLLVEFSLHDGIVTKVALKGDRLTLTLFPYDLQDDPYILRLTYEGGGGLQPAYLQLAQFKKGEAQILAHELDQTASGFVHRMLFWTQDFDYQEVEIPFLRLRMELPE
ncbi:MAG: hypothetical protein SFU83_07215 [Meiothermus sp.]|nr:hypothetical protein [Meiothermus sp.]